MFFTVVSPNLTVTSLNENFYQKQSSSAFGNCCFAMIPFLLFNSQPLHNTLLLQVFEADKGNQYCENK